MVCNGKWNEMERKVWCGIWKMPESKGIEDLKNEMENNLPFFHSNPVLDFFPDIYRKIKLVYTMVMTKNIWKHLAANHLSTN